MRLIQAIKAWFSSIKHYIQSTIRELNRIQWPTRPQTIRLTGVVIGACIVIGSMLFVIDLMLLEGLTYLIQ